MKHRWNDPVRPDLNNTFRSCRNCGLIKITRHEPDNTPRHWIEYRTFHGQKVAADRTPVCEAA